MKKKFVILSAVLLFLIPVLLLAQGEVDPDFPFEVNDAIVAGIQTLFGIGLMAIVQFVKAGIKKVFPKYDEWEKIARHALMYGVTLLIAAGATYFTLTQMKMLETTRLIFYTVYTWGYINQFWKALKELTAKTR